MPQNEIKLYLMTIPKMRSNELTYTRNQMNENGKTKRPFHRTKNIYEFYGVQPTNSVMPLSLLIRTQFRMFDMYFLILKFSEKIILL